MYMLFAFMQAIYNLMVAFLDLKQAIIEWNCLFFHVFLRNNQLYHKIVFDLLVACLNHTHGPDGPVMVVLDYLCLSCPVG